jgi:hypothetical protein
MDETKSQQITNKFHNAETQKASTVVSYVILFVLVTVTSDVVDKIVVLNPLKPEARLNNI